MFSADRAREAEARARAEVEAQAAAAAYGQRDVVGTRNMVWNADVNIRRTPLRMYPRHDSDTIDAPL